MVSAVRAAIFLINNGEPALAGEVLKLARDRMESVMGEGVAAGKKIPV